MGCPACGKERVDDAVGMVAMATGFIAFEVMELAACGGAGQRGGRRNPVERQHSSLQADQWRTSVCVCVCVRERH